LGHGGPLYIFSGYHFNPPWEIILCEGLESYAKKVKARLEKLDLANPKDMGVENFLNALSIVINAVKAFAERYADEADKLAEKESRVTRKKELQQIAEACRRVPYYGARNFFEAMQSLWFIHNLFHIEGTGPGYTIGRFDHYMYPYYKSDLEKGMITQEEAQELIEHLYINMTNVLFLYNTKTAQGSAGFTQYQTMCLGGVDEFGKDASNELSYLCLEAAKAVRTTQPDIVLLCHPRETPYKIKMKAAELVQLG